MKRVLSVAVLTCLLAGSVAAHAGETLDRIIAVVNNTPILLSDWYEEWQCEALLAGRTPESYSKKEQQEMFDRLVDQELLQQQMHGYPLAPVSPADLQERVKAVRTQLSGTIDAEWQSMLQRAGITEERLSAHLRKQMEIERFLESRFRPGIRVDDRSIRRYYEDTFLPQLHARGAKEVPLEEVSSKIREILTQQRMDEQVSGWMQTLREQTEIRIPPAINSDEAEVEVNQSK